ncbi:hypothetical protein CYY_004117 [Polysphondylium violaceum]|uniref:Cleft lip and palate associated transmembrane protein n=1 Tax=Polysphondylium violaceum TaxID=133409 RepID=A0A8J4PVX1_9MYCE|nr:hypothetical protein CYY_004117 [Polysphondylium violaceum]
MPTGEQSVAAPAAAGQPAQQGGWRQAIATFFRFMILYYLASFVFSKLLGFGNQTVTAPQQQVVLDNSGQAVEIQQEPTQIGNIYNSWDEASDWSLKVYFSESNTTVGDWLVWEEKGLTYDFSDYNTITKNFTFNTPKFLQNNGTLYAHIFATKPRYLNKPASTLYKVHSLVKYLPRPKPKGKNLLSEEKNPIEEVVYDPKELISYWKPSLSLHLIVDHTVHPPRSIPQEVYQHFNITGDKYTPILYINEFWIYREHLSPINETVQELSIEFHTSPMGPLKWQFQMQAQKSFETQEMLGAGENMGDDFKRMLTDTNPYLLGLTFVVTILHTVFEFLAFKNDIQFWKNNKSMEGLSVRSIILHAVSQLIVFLYLLDNETSYMILVSCGFSIVIEVWKIGKAMIVELKWNGMIPSLTFENKESYKSKTKQYDEMAMKYLSWVFVPLVIGTSIYSLYYNEYKSWYSWVISSLVRTVYTFEFIMMTPQLFINYKMKSVAHLPGRVFMYRALNTFIDDLFAFIIKMPIMHRLSCLRDDIIFIIYLYQRWIYPVDKKRSQYGSEEEEEESEKGKTITPTPTTTTTTEKDKLKLENSTDNSDTVTNQDESESSATTTDTQVKKRKSKKVE